MAILDPKRIVTAARFGWEKRAWIRHNQKIATTQLAGPYFGACVEPSNRKGVGTTQPVSVLGSMMDAYLPQMVGARWKVKCSPKLTGFSGEGTMRSLRLTHLADEMKIAAQDRLVVMDAILSGEGLYRVGLKDGIDWIRVDSEIHDPGQPFVLRVAPGNRTSDVLARHPDERWFDGDRFIADRQILLENGIGDPDWIKSLPNISHPDAQSDPNSPIRLAGASQDAILSDDLIELWYLIVWDGSKRLEMMVPNLDSVDKFVIAPREYQGYEAGPYESIRLYEHPDSADGISLAMRLMDLHLAVQNVAERCIRHILKTKRNPIYWEEAGKDTAMAINEADDDEPIAGDPNSVKEIVTGGLIDQFQQGLKMMMGMADNAGASLQQTSGREGVADTATEASIIAGKAQNLVQLIRSPIEEARRNICQHLAWFEDTGPVRQQIYSVTTGPGMKSNVVYDRATMEGDFTDFLYDATVEFATGMDASTRIVRLQQIVAVMPPFIQMVQMFGGDIRAAMDLFSSDFPELADVFPTGLEQSLQIMQEPGMIPPGGQLPPALQQAVMSMIQQATGGKGGKGAPPGAGKSKPPGAASGNPMQQQLAQRASDRSAVTPRPQ